MCILVIGLGYLEGDGLSFWEVGLRKFRFLETIVVCGRGRTRQLFSKRSFRWFFFGLEFSFGTNFRDFSLKDYLVWKDGFIGSDRFFGGFIRFVRVQEAGQDIRVFVGLVAVLGLQVVVIFVMNQSGVTYNLFQVFFSLQFFLFGFLSICSFDYFKGIKFGI